MAASSAVVLLNLAVPSYLPDFVAVNVPRSLTLAELAAQLAALQHLHKLTGGHQVTGVSVTSLPKSDASPSAAKSAQQDEEPAYKANGDGLDGLLEDLSDIRDKQLTPVVVLHCNNTAAASVPKNKVQVIHDTREPPEEVACELFE